MLFAYIRADFKKIKGLRVFLLHLLIPVCTAVAFLAYYLYAPWNVYSKLEAYFQVLATALPFLSGLFCAVLSEQELMAGLFQNMLAVPCRMAAFYSKLFVLIILGAAAVLLASVLFGAGFCFITENVDFSLYFIMAAVITGSSIFLYVIHLFLAIRFNKGVAAGAGLAGSMVSALFLTNLGDNIWIYTPVAWASRLVTMLLPDHSVYGIITINYNKECNLAAVICIISTISALMAFGAWALKWDGIKGSE